MTPEEMERAIQFILSQQAQFMTDLQQMREDAKESRLASDHRHAQVTEAVMGLTAGLGGLTSITSQLASAQIESARQIGDVALSLRQTDTRLDALIALFERQLRERGDEGLH